MSVENSELIPLLEESEKLGSKIIVIREENVRTKAYLPIVQYHGKKFVLICATKRCHFISVVLSKIQPLLHIITSTLQRAQLLPFALCRVVSS